MFIQFNRYPVSGGWGLWLGSIYVSRWPSQHRGVRISWNPGA